MRIVRGAVESSGSRTGTSIRSRSIRSTAGALQTTLMTPSFERQRFGLTFLAAQIRLCAVGAVLRSTYLDRPVWDGVRLSADQLFTVAPVAGSVQFMTSHITQSDNRKLPDAVFGSAQLIGDRGQDGILRACVRAESPHDVDCHVLVYAQIQVRMV